MITIAGHWEIGYNTPMIEAYQWRFPLFEWGVDKWLMCPVSGIKTVDGKLNLQEFPDYEKMLESCPGLVRIFVEPRTKHQNPETIWLDDFEHPNDVVYVFGSAHMNPTLGFKREQDSVVSIKTKIDSGGLWPSQCLCLVLDDRRRKNGSYNS
jgi:hypothetical protein